MTDHTDRFKENTPGRYYVAKLCIGCALCAEIAPESFMQNMDEEIAVDHCYVYRQPENEAAESLCQEAKSNCPAGAIENNGST